MSEATEICIFDAIGSDGVTGASVIAQLKAANGGPVVVRINSDGGNVTEGVAIYNALRRYTGGVTVIVDYAASIASYIALAGNRVLIAENGYLMIHNPTCRVNGGSEEMRQTASLIDRMSETLCAAYVLKCGKPASEIAAAMDAETWFTAQEAMAFGLVDEITEGLAMAAKFDLTKFRNAPRVDTRAASMATTVRNEDAPDETAPTPDAPAETEHTDPVALDPCPFCDSAELDDSGEQIKCTNCQAVGPVAGSGMDSRGAWNNRAEADAPELEDVPAPEADPMAVSARLKTADAARKAFVTASQNHAKAHAVALQVSALREELATVRAIAAEVISAKVEAKKAASALAEYKSDNPKRVQAAALIIAQAQGIPPVITAVNTEGNANPGKVAKPEAKGLGKVEAAFREQLASQKN